VLGRAVNGNSGCTTAWSSLVYVFLVYLYLSPVTIGLFISLEVQTYQAGQAWTQLFLSPVCGETAIVVVQ